MSACPKCGAAVEADFGIYTCSKCGTVLNVSFSGDISIAADVADPVVFEEPAQDAVAPVEMPPFESFATEPVEGQAYVASVYGEEPPLTDSEVENAIEEPSADEVAVIPPNSDFMPDYLAEAPVEAPVEPSPAAAASVSDGPLDFRDVEEYANNSELGDSPLVYTLWIQDINTASARAKLSDVLSDVRLNLHLPDLLPRLKNGTLEISGLNPVKASVIAMRLREESVTFTWKQSVYEASPETENEDPHPAVDGTPT